MLVELKSFHHNRSYNCDAGSNKKEIFILAINHRISNFVKRLLGSVVKEIAPC